MEAPSEYRGKGMSLVTGESVRLFTIGGGRKVRRVWMRTHITKICTIFSCLAFDNVG